MSAITEALLHKRQTNLRVLLCSIPFVGRSIFSRSVIFIPVLGAPLHGVGPGLAASTSASVAITSTNNCFSPFEFGFEVCFDLGEVCP